MCTVQNITIYTQQLPATAMKFVLVHSVWHHGGHWKPVRECLEAEGHEVHTPTIGGLQTGANTQDYPNLETAYAPVLAYILNNDLTDYSLLGHSYGGMISSKVCLVPVKCVDADLMTVGSEDEWHEEPTQQTCLSGHVCTRGWRLLLRYARRSK